MKKILTLCALCVLCGCNRPTESDKWQYTTRTLDNDSTRVGDTALAKRDYSTSEYSKTGCGDFSTTFLLDDGLRKMGSEGWELVSATPLLRTHFTITENAGRPYVRTEKILLIFKRRL